MYANRVFLSLLRALGIASAKPERYEVILRRATLDDLAFNLPKYLEHPVRPVLSNIRTLFLDFSSYSHVVQVDIDDKKVICANYHLRKFLAEVSQLEHLRLNFHAGRYDGRPNVDDLLSWLAKPVSSDFKGHTSSTKPRFPYIQPVQFENLRELEIGKVSADSKVLLSLIRKYRGMCNFPFDVVHYQNPSRDIPKSYLSNTNQPRCASSASTNCFWSSLKRATHLIHQTFGLDYSARCRNWIST